MNGFITTKEVSEKLKVSVRRVQALIAAGRLPAEKIGNSYAIREADLALLNGRKNGRPKPPKERTQEQWNPILDRNIGPTIAKERSRILSRRLIEKPPHQRTAKEWNLILDKILGSVSLGPRDLSTNKKHMEGFGRENAYRR